MASRTKPTLNRAARAVAPTRGPRARQRTGAPESRDSWKIQPLTPARWDDFVELFGPRGACAGCWCTWARFTHAEFKAASPLQRRAHIRRVVSGGTPPGLIAYDGTTPVNVLYFALVFLDRNVPRIGKESQQFAFIADMRERVLAKVQRCIDERLFPESIRADVAMRLLWAPIIGITTFQLSNRMPPDVDADALVRDAIDTTIAGLQAGVARHSTSSLATV